jgi:hypothetical protein
MSGALHPHPAIESRPSPWERGEDGEDEGFRQLFFQADSYVKLLISGVIDGETYQEEELERFGLLDRETPYRMCRVMQALRFVAQTKGRTFVISELYTDDQNWPIGARLLTDITDHLSGYTDDLTNTYFPHDESIEFSELTFDQTERTLEQLKEVERRYIAAIYHGWTHPRAFDTARNVIWFHWPIHQEVLLESERRHATMRAEEALTWYQEQEVQLRQRDALRGWRAPSLMDQLASSCKRYYVTGSTPYEICGLSMLSRYIVSHLRYLSRNPEVRTVDIERLGGYERFRPPGSDRTHIEEPAAIQGPDGRLWDDGIQLYMQRAHPDINSQIPSHADILGFLRAFIDDQGIETIEQLDKTVAEMEVPQLPEMSYPGSREILRRVLSRHSYRGIFEIARRLPPDLQGILYHATGHIPGQFRAGTVQDFCRRTHISLSEYYKRLERLTRDCNTSFPFSYDLPGIPAGAIDRLVAGYVRDHFDLPDWVRRKYLGKRESN